MNNHIFREYDIRGVVDHDLTDSTVFDIGRAFGSMISRRDGKRVTVGGDCRLSTERFRKAVIQGILSAGIDVVDIGICTTPILYYSLHTLSVDGGVMITGSHNPSNQNGFKLCIGKDSIYGRDIQSLYEIICSADYASGEAVCTACDVVTPYKEYMTKSFNFTRKMRIAIDAGNGTAGEIILPILKKLNVDVLPLNCHMDGSFPVHHPDPTVEENLLQIIDVVRKEKLDCGIGFDGDTDRIGVVDNNGSIVWGDLLMILYARDILKRNPCSTIISEVKSSQILYDDIKAHGGIGIMWKAGHSLIKNKMKETHAALAGEMSGHMFFADRFFGFDDAIYAALRLLEIISNSDQQLSHLLLDVPKTVSTHELRVECPDDIKFRLVEMVKKKLEATYVINDIDGVRVQFDDGWALIRASNTQPILVTRFEAMNQESLIHNKMFIDQTIHEARIQLQ
jgi:phosphomannomutase/phosphoglucomutase